MKGWLKAVLALAVAGSITGCASKHPLGMSETEWNSLTFEEQIEANQRQVALDAAGRYQRDNRRRELARLKISSSSEPEFGHIAYIHTDYFYSDNNRADCVIQGEVRNSFAWQKAYPVHFVVRNGFPQVINIESWDGSFSRRAVVAFDSMGVQVCETHADLGSASNRCLEAERSGKWLEGGEIVASEADGLFRGTAQCHIYQDVWKPSQGTGKF